MQQILDAAKEAATSTGADELRGVSVDQTIAAVQVITEGLDKLPPTTSLHAALFGITFVRNAIIMAMHENQARMEVTAEMSS